MQALPALKLTSHVTLKQAYRFLPLSYTTNPTERSTSKIFRSTSEIILESSVESQQALAECSASNDRACLSIAHRALNGILQTILRQFRSSSEKICSSSAQWDQWCKHFSKIYLGFIILNSQKSSKIINLQKTTMCMQGAPGTRFLSSQASLSKHLACTCSFRASQSQSTHIVLHCTIFSGHMAISPACDWPLSITSCQNSFALVQTGSHVAHCIASLCTSHDYFHSM